MKPLSVIILVFILATCTLTGCVSAPTDYREKELAMSRYLERAIEVGEKAIEEQELVQHVALAEGTHAAVKLNDEIHRHDHYEQFGTFLKQADSVWETIPDTSVQIAVRSHLMPYVEHIMEITEKILL